jgi:hypothetical protein
MTEALSPKDAARLVAALARHNELSHQRVEGGGLSPEMAMLRAWQAQRLARTYADFLADPRYELACRFFLDDIYAPKDFSQRNQDILRIHDFMSRFIPARALKTLTHAIELHNMTEELDEKLLDVLLNQVGVTDSISEEQYAEAYRLCDNYDDRVKQIEMIVEIGRDLEKLVRHRVIGWTLRAARGPAYRAGWRELQDFLERGFTAFRRMGKADKFLNAIHDREMKILDNIYAGKPHPFDI